MLNENIPALKASYQLERSSAELQAYLNEIRTTQTLVRFNQLKAGLQNGLEAINQSTIKLTKSKVVNNLREEYQILGFDIKRNIKLLTLKVQLKQQLAKTLETILWLHQDIVDELNPLLQEMEWQITRDHVMVNSVSQSTLYDDFSTLQMLTINENELVSLVQEIIRQYKQRNLNSAFHFLGYKTSEIEILSKKLQHNAASITHRQLLLELISIVRPDGKLQSILNQLMDVTEQANQQDITIKLRLASQQKQIKNLVNKASIELAGIKLDAEKTISTGNVVLFFVLVSALLSSAFIYMYFVRKRIFGRLYDLSVSLNAVVTGETSLPISVTGQDEIGRLGENLQNFCLQMQEIEKTNALNLINNTQASIITCTTEGTIESMNSSAKELFPLHGISAEPDSIWQLFDLKQHQQLKEIFFSHSTLLREGAYNLTLAINDTHHSIQYFRLDLRVFQQNMIPKVIVTLTDITEQENIARWLEQKVKEKTQSLTSTNAVLHGEIEERKRAEANLVATQEELIQAAKMAVLGQAMTTLAHELNQPLSALSTYIYTVQMTYHEGEYPEIYKTMGLMDEICERMDTIIANLRSFSKKPMASTLTHKVNMHHATDNAIGIAASRAKQHNIQLNNLLDNHCFCIGELIQIEQVIVNLLLNSCDALAPLVKVQGCVYICQLARTEHSLILACCDNGSGFDHEIINQLFTPFTTTKEVGLGLGLNICRSIMTRLNGTIQLASTLDGGAMIVLEFQVK